MFYPVWISSDQPFAGASRSQKLLKSYFKTISDGDPFADPPKNSNN
ncbi:hypothetical protein [Xenococcus sp. PCC 7305]|nr:hypothetical protein [Xenococcus sp. PCC 7305]